MNFSPNYIFILLIIIGISGLSYVLYKKGCSVKNSIEKLKLNLRTIQRYLVNKENELELDLSTDSSGSSSGEEEPLNN